MELINATYAKQQRAKRQNRKVTRPDDPKPFPNPTKTVPVPEHLTPAQPSPLVTSTKFLIRKDFSDIYLFSAITPNDQAEGAEISWTRDSISKDTIWAIDGMAALVFSYLVDDYRSPSLLISFSLAPYVKVDKEFHTNPEPSDADIVTAGARLNF
jgi:hypothetical protein